MHPAQACGQGQRRERVHVPDKAAAARGSPWRSELREWSTHRLQTIGEPTRTFRPAWVSLPYLRGEVVPLECFHSLARRRHLMGGITTIRTDIQRPPWAGRLIREQRERRMRHTYRTRLPWRKAGCAQPAVRTFMPPTWQGGEAIRRPCPAYRHSCRRVRRSSAARPTRHIPAHTSSGQGHLAHIL